MLYEYQQQNKFDQFRNWAYKIIFYMALGLGFEVVFTSVSCQFLYYIYGGNDGGGNNNLYKIPYNHPDVTTLYEIRRNLWGFSSIYYMPIYACVPMLIRVVKLLINNFNGLSTIKRGAIYATVCIAFEIFTMHLLYLIFNIEPSTASYTENTYWHLFGYTRLDYFPIFMLLALLFEKFDFFINNHQYNILLKK